MLKAVIIALIVLTLLLVFQQEVCDVLDSTKTTIKGWFVKEKLCNSCYKPSLATELLKKQQEHFVDDAPYQDKPLPWVEHLTNTEVSSAMKQNHADFTANLSKFYLGPDFTSVPEDNRDAYSTNFVGLRRPENVKISDYVQQRPDVDQKTLEKNGNGWGTYFTRNTWTSQLKK